MFQAGAVAPSSFLFDQLVVLPGRGDNCGLSCFVGLHLPDTLSPVLFGVTRPPYAEDVLLVMLAPRALFP